MEDSKDEYRDQVIPEDDPMEQMDQSQFKNKGRAEPLPAAPKPIIHSAFGSVQESNHYQDVLEFPVIEETQSKQKEKLSTLTSSNTISGTSGNVSDILDWVSDLTLVYRKS